MRIGHSDAACRLNFITSIFSGWEPVLAHLLASRNMHSKAMVSKAKHSKAMGRKDIQPRGILSRAIRNRQDTGSKDTLPRGMQRSPTLSKVW